MDFRHHFDFVLLSPVEHLVDVGPVLRGLDVLQVLEASSHFRWSIWSHTLFQLNPVPVAHRQSDELDAPVRHLLEVFLQNSVIKVGQHPPIFHVA